MAGVRRLEGLKDEILLVPLPGHTRGHAGVAVKRRSGWLLHAGDAIMCKQELEGEGGPKLGIYHRLADGDPEQGREARAQLADLGADHGVRIICSHDYEDFQAITA